MRVSFRLLNASDAPQVIRWLRDEEVARWWWSIRGKSDEALMEEWNRKANGREDSADRYIITVDGVDIGQIQVQALDAQSGHGKEIGIPGAAGVDVFIGETGWRDRGVGTAVVREFVDRIVFSLPGVRTCTIDPEPENRRAIRCYEKAGFMHVRTYRSEISGFAVYLMRLDRPVQRVK